MKQLPLSSPSLRYTEQAFKEWLDILGYSSQTVYQLPNCVREFFHYLECQGHSQITELKPQHFKTYYQHLKQRSNTTRGGGLSNNYLNKHLQALYKLMDYLRQNGKLTLPYLNLKSEEANSKAIEVLTVEEIKQLYQVADQHPNGTVWEVIAARDKAMLSVFYSCGLRRNEGVHLDVSDINFDRQLLHVRKGKNYKERFVPFNKTTSKIIEHYVFDYRPWFTASKEKEALFMSIKGNRMGGQSLGLRLKLLQQRVDDLDLQQKDLTLHTLRHSIATHLLQAGMELEKISRFLGHSSLESTQIYTHLAVNE